MTANIVKPLLLSLCFIAFIHFANAQKIPREEILQQINVGNTLREAQQYEKAVEYLMQALEGLETEKNKYWMASAYENLGMIYRDLQQPLQSITYFNKALDLYQSLGMKTSALGVQILLEGVEDKERIYAGIEIGAKGVKISVIGVKLNIEGVWEYDIKMDDAINTNIVSLADSSVDQTIEAVNQFLKIAREEYKIPEEKIFVVGSSGIRDEAQKAGKLSQIEGKIAKSIDSKYPMRFISPEEEALLVIQGTTLRRFRAISSTIDIGSGNTKGGFLFGENLENLRSVAFPFGTKTLVDKIEETRLANDIKYDSAASIVEREFVRPAIRAQYNRIDGLKTRSVVHLVGGVVWTMATYLYPEEIHEVFVKLSATEVQKFRKMVAQDYYNLTHPDLNLIVEEKARKKIEQELEEARENFSQKELIAGAIILEAIVTEYNASPPQKRFLYARKGYIGWITGYIMQAVSKEFEQLDK